MTGIWNMFCSGLQMVFECWPVKTAIALISTVICWLFGGSGTILAVVILFVALDTLTKWTVIIKRYLADQGKPNTGIAAILRGFFSAWKPGYLSSAELRKCWGEKLLTYLVLIIFAGGVAKLPEIVMFGTAVNSAITGGIYSLIALTELFSIGENLEELGNKNVSQLKNLACLIINRASGGTINLNGEEKKDG